MKRHRNPRRFRKRQSANRQEHDPRSVLLRELGIGLQRRRYAEALTEIDRQVAQTTDQDFRARLLALGADSLYKQGKFSEAADAYGNVARLIEGQPLRWFRPVVGEIRSLLRSVQVEQAQTRATAALQVATAHWQQYQQQVAQAPAIVAAGGQAVIPARPPAPVSIANRLAKYFLAEGEVAISKALFQQALELSPNSFHARLGLAAVALRENNGAEAARLAREALVQGQFHAKTLPAWPLLLAAGRKTGVDQMDGQLLKGLAQATPGVRARAVLAIAHGLRGQGDARWLPTADEWLRKAAPASPTIAAELNKLKLANSRAQSAPLTEQQQRAHALMKTPGLSPTETLSAAKEIVRTSLLLKQVPAIDAMIAEAVKRFGAVKRAAFIHGLALACSKANRGDLATQLLQRNTTDPVVTPRLWGRSVWALARVQSNAGNHSDSAASYWTFSQNTQMAQRFRLYATAQWALELFRANQRDLIEQAAPQLEVAVQQIQDWNLLLDVARRLFFSQFQRGIAISTAAYERGKKLAWQAFDSTQHPSPAAAILLKLARRAADRSRFDDVVATWTRLDEAKRRWLWSTNADYWTWLQQVARGYSESGRLAEAETLLTTAVQDPATPPEGFAIVGAGLAEVKWKQQGFPGLFAICEQVVQTAPSSESAAAAHIWLAVRAWKREDQAQASGFAQKALTALGKNCQLYWKEATQARAYCLLAGLDLTRVSAQCPCGTGALQAQLGEIQTILSTLPDGV
jgi:tetratricopeptide (TPR) repeat protein